MVFAQQLMVDARLVIKTLDIRVRDELHEIAVARLVFCEQNQMIVFDAVHLGALVAVAGRDIDVVVEQPVAICCFLRRKH